MENRIAAYIEEPAEEREGRITDARPIRDVLEELFAQYQKRFPGVRIALVETPVQAF